MLHLGDMKPGNEPLSINSGLYATLSTEWIHRTFFQHVISLAASTNPFSCKMPVLLPVSNSV